MERTVVITKSTDYGKIKFMRGNRSISLPHLANLTKNILRRNLLPYEPIIINEHYEIIDGQHRFMIAQTNKIPFYYVVLEGGSLTDVQMLNSGTSNWSCRDYMNSYASTGIKSYELLKYYTDTFSLSPMNLLRLLPEHVTGGSEYSKFKKGLFIVEDESAAEMRILAYMKLKHYCETLKVFQDRDFVNAFLKFIKTKTVEELIAQCELYNQKIVYHEKERDYLHQFADILNWRKKKNRTPFF